ncbi:glycosyltransferase family 4 protein [Pusillimonas sp.]|uniref:glycosyltransferase family 4 protein n=1 Tax=Pusillimonas sp. TaxID=3040095 RepID=UPI0037CA4022
MMKILITDIHHGNGGGHVTYILNLLRGLKDQCNLTLAAPASGRLFDLASKIQGVRTVPCLYTSRPLPLLNEVLSLRRFLARESFDVVHVNGSADHRHMMLARLGLRRQPAIVWTKHNTKSIDSFGHRLRARFGTDAAIGVSKYVTGQLENSCYKRCDVHSIYHGIDPHFFLPVTAEQRKAYRAQLFGGLPEDILVFGSTGGTDLDKGWMLLAEAVTALPVALRTRVRIVVAGDLPPPGIIERLRGIGLDDDQIVFPGLVKDVRPILGACDVGFVLSYHEAASYALYEAMSVGLPALVSDAGGLPEGVHENSVGWVTPAGDVEALTKCLHTILGTDPAVLMRMGSHARARIEDVFSLSAFLKHTNDVYRRAASATSAGR